MGEPYSRLSGFLASLCTQRISEKPSVFAHFQDIAYRVAEVKRRALLLLSELGNEIFHEIIVAQWDSSNRDR